MTRENVDQASFWDELKLELDEYILELKMSWNYSKSETMDPLKNWNHLPLLIRRVMSITKNETIYPYLFEEWSTLKKL